MSSNMKMAIGVILVLAAAFSRLIPHPMNFAPITAIALFGGMYFDKRFAPILPLAALMISDYFLGFYEGIVWVYSGFLLISVLGMFAARKRSFAVITGSTVAGSILFFVITNFGVWQSGVLYPLTMTGLTECYIAAVPFFRNALVGDLFYSGVLFGSVALIEKYLPTAAAHKA
jgi:hypothetical protein